MHTEHINHHDGSMGLPRSNPASVDPFFQREGRPGGGSGGPQGNLGAPGTGDGNADQSKRQPKPQRSRKQRHQPRKPKQYFGLINSYFHLGQCF